MNASGLSRAIESALANDWDDAHRVVQESDDEYACWIHTVLHRIEGDESNSRYWYRRAGREYDGDLSPIDELEQIKGL